MKNTEKIDMTKIDTSKLDFLFTFSIIAIIIILIIASFAIGIGHGRCYKCNTQTISKDGKITIERTQVECGDYLKISNYVAKNTYTIDSVQIKTTCK